MNRKFIRFMIAFNVFWIWVGSGILTYGFVNAYNIFNHCNPREWSKRESDTQAIYAIIIFAPIATVIEIPRVGFGLVHGINYNPGCPVE